MTNSNSNALRRRHVSHAMQHATLSPAQAAERIAKLERELPPLRHELSRKEQELRSLRALPFVKDAPPSPNTSPVTVLPQILRKIVDNVPVMIALFEPSAGTCFLNRYTRDLLGLDETSLSAEELMARCYPDPSYRHMIREHMLKTPTGWKEVEMVVRDNRRITASLRGVRLSDGEYLGIGIDITERKRLQEALLRGEKELRQSRHLKLLARLTTGVAHEVRNPLTAIMGIMEALQTELSPPSGYEEYLKHLDTQVKRLEGLMQDLLTLGRPVKRSAMRPVSIGDLTAGAVDMWNASTSSPLPVVSLQIAPRVESDLVPADRSLLCRAIVNLLENADEHAPHGSPIILQAERGDNRRILIRVIDKGPGMAPVQLAGAFEPFYTTRKAGIGLGLSLARQIIVGHGGEVRLFNNEPGPGLTAEISLPLFNPES